MAFRPRYFTRTVSPNENNILYNDQDRFRSTDYYSDFTRAQGSYRHQYSRPPPLFARNMAPANRFINRGHRQGTGHMGVGGPKTITAHTAKLLFHSAQCTYQANNWAHTPKSVDKNVEKLLNSIMVPMPDQGSNRDKNELKNKWCQEINSIVNRHLHRKQAETDSQLQELLSNNADYPNIDQLPDGAKQVTEKYLTKHYGRKLTATRKQELLQGAMDKLRGQTTTQTLSGRREATDTATNIASTTTEGVNAIATIATPLPTRIPQATETLLASNTIELDNRNPLRNSAVLSPGVKRLNSQIKLSNRFSCLKQFTPEIEDTDVSEDEGPDKVTPPAKRTMSRDTPPPRDTQPPRNEFSLTTDEWPTLPEGDLWWANQAPVKEPTEKGGRNSTNSAEKRNKAAPAPAQETAQAGPSTPALQSRTITAVPADRTETATTGDQGEQDTSVTLSEAEEILNASLSPARPCSQPTTLQGPRDNSPPVPRPQRLSASQKLTTTNKAHVNPRKERGLKNNWTIQVKYNTKVLILTDSNFKRACNLPPGWQVEAYPGASLCHIERLAKLAQAQIQNTPGLQSVILSVGINDRDNDWVGTTQKQTNQIIRTINAFPKTCPCHFLEIAIPDHLDPGRTGKAKENLTKLNNHVASKLHPGLFVLNIPHEEVMTDDRQNIHYDQDTMNRIMDNLYTYFLGAGLTGKGPVAHAHH